MRTGIRFMVCATLLGSGAVLAQGGEYRGRGVEAGRGGYFLVGAGTEGYTGALASAVQPGFAYGALAGVKATPLLGVEVGFSGSVSELDLSQGQGDEVGGVDLVRSGGQVAATLGFTTTRLQPYAVGGIGFEGYSVRAGMQTGFSDDTNGYVPAGLGMRYQLGPTLTMDARLTYNVPFDQNFGPVPVDDLYDARYQGLLQLGGSY